MDQKEYNKKFCVNDKNNKLLKAAFSQASDIRKFEIELYWKRATYFWALIALAFTGYFAVLSSNSIENKYFLSSVISCIGLVLTVGWYLASRGSKYWQENWENHIDLLEDNITGPLYKTSLERPKNDPFFEKYIIGPASISVSKINHLICLFIVFVWILLICFSLYHHINGIIKYLNFINIILLVLTPLFSLLVCAIMCIKAKTHKSNHFPNAEIRETKIK